MVSIANFGILNSLYLVKKINHRLSSSEWTMTLELLNNATSRDFLAECVRGFAPVVNEQTPPTPAGDAEGGGTDVDPEILSAVDAIIAPERSNAELDRDIDQFIRGL
jgi:hypothetical protein